MTGLVKVMKGSRGGKTAQRDKDHNCIVPFILGALRKSMVSCRVDPPDDVISAVSHTHMETGWPTNVHHITHVTFDRFHGFLGLPPEFQLEIPGRVPSASVSVFGVSAESMQCSYDAKGNSIPTILLLMQERLYSQGGLKAEGIFRINPENSEEENVREQLNRGNVPEEMDVHCLAGLIKAWFRELPSGVLDGLSPEQVLECHTEQEYVELVNQLKPTEAALLNWAVDLMADVVERQHHNKMNTRNIAMVFAPNMTQMSDPLTALMHAVQVMNLLNTLITRTLVQREQTAAAGYSPTSFHSSEDEYESQQEMDTNSGGEEDGEAEPLCESEIRECSLKPLDAYIKVFSVEPGGLLQKESAMSFTDDSTTGNSCFSSPYEENSRTTPSAAGSIADTSSPSIEFTGNGATVRI